MIFTLTTMKSRIILCLSVVLHAVSCTHQFLAVDQDRKCSAVPDNLEKCAQQCIDSINSARFCYGFTLTPDGKCTPNNEAKVLTTETYYLLQHYHDARECPKEKIITKEEAEGLTRKFEDPQVRYHDGAFFLLHKKPIPMSACVKKCEENGSKMASIHNKEENEFVKDFCANQAPSKFAFGCGLGVTTKVTGLDKDGNELYQEILNVDKTSMDYTNWAGQEPASSKGTREECVAMYTSKKGETTYNESWKLGQWNNMECKTEILCLCRK